MKKIFFLSVVAALFLCSACSGMNDKLANGSMSFETTEFPNQNSSGNENLPGNTHYFEITITNIQTKAQQVVYMNQNEKQFIELEPGKYSVYILGQTDDCEYEWQSDDKNPIVVKKNKITAVSAKMWEKDPEYWFEQKPGKYLPINDNIAPMYSGSLKTGEEVFLFWVNLDNAEDTIKPGEEIKTKISKRFIPHIVKTEPLMLVFEQNVFSISSTAQNVKLEYTASADCIVKYLVNSKTVPETLDAFKDALVYSDKYGITVSSGDEMTIYAVAIPLDTDLTHSTSEIIKLTFKKSYNKSVTFTVPEIKAEDSKLKISVDYDISVDKITQRFNVVNIDDYDSKKITWFGDNLPVTQKNCFEKVVSFPTDTENTYYQGNIACMAGDKEGNYDFLKYSDYFEIVDISNNSNYYLYDDGKGCFCLRDFYDDILDNCIWFLEGELVDSIKYDMENNEKSLVCVRKSINSGYVVFYVYKTVISLH